MRSSAALTRTGAASPFLAGIEPLESRVLFSTLYVDPSASTSPYNGSSWTHAYQTLTAALAAAGSGATIRVAGSASGVTYLPTTYGSGNTLATFQMKTGVTISGGWEGLAGGTVNAGGG